MSDDIVVIETISERDAIRRRIEGEMGEKLSKEDMSPENLMNMIRLMEGASDNIVSEIRKLEVRNKQYSVEVQKAQVMLAAMQDNDVQIGKLNLQLSELQMKTGLLKSLLGHAATGEGRKKRRKTRRSKKTRKKRGRKRRKTHRR